MERYDYTLSHGIYASGAEANGATITIESGSASVYKGLPDGAHSLVASVNAGGSYVVRGVGGAEVVSVQNGASFSYTIELADAGPIDPPPVDPIPEISGASTNTVWSCAGPNCPWGTSVSGQAIDWPAAVAPSNVRYDYVTSANVYVSDDYANGMAIRVDSGAALIFRGTPQGTDDVVAYLGAGDVYVVDDFLDGEVLSVESQSSFTYTLLPPPSDDPPPDDPPPVDPGPSPDTNSTWVTWTCGGANCPWGASLSGEAAEWPAEQLPHNTRYDYTTSHGLYLPADAANRLTIAVGSGSAVLYAGPLDGAHRTVAELASGEVYTVSGLAADEVLSAQSSGQFSFGTEFSDETNPGTGDPPADDPQPGSWPPGIGPVVPGAVSSVDATWECETPGCMRPPSTGAVIDWPEWSAYSNNGQSDPELSLTVYDGDGSELHPYMGRWAEGCLVTAEAGNVVVVELQRGATTWRATWLAPGESHQIALQDDEDGAIIESGDGGSGFAVSLVGCEPAPVPHASAPVDPSHQMLEYAGTSELVTWSCNGTDCPWGTTVAATAATWPAEANPGSARYDYAASKGIYLTADVATGLEITVETGVAYVFVGTTDGRDVVVATLSNGASYVVSNLAPGDVVSLEGNSPFTYRVEPPDPDRPVLIESVAAYWHCDMQGCDLAPWTGRVIDWNHWSAYQSNARSAESTSRTIYDGNGEPLHPYMGAWADGCTVNAIEGQVLIVEWERGTDVWRETYLDPGESYTINLIGSEDGALIESNDINGPFSVTLEGCQPEPLP